MLGEFELLAFREFASKFGLKRMSKQKKEMVTKVCESIVIAKEINAYVLVPAVFLLQYIMEVKPCMGHNPHGT